MRLQVKTVVFEPEGERFTPLQRRLLLQDHGLRISTAAADADYDDLPDDAWPKERVDRLNTVRTEVLKRMQGAGEEE